MNTMPRNLALLIVVLLAGCATSSVPTNPAPAAERLPAPAPIAEDKLPAPPAGVFRASEVDTPPTYSAVGFVSGNRDMAATNLAANVGPGTATVILVISKRGKIADIDVYQATSPAHAAAAKALLERAQFKPALKQGEAVSCQIVQTFAFPITVRVEAAPQGPSPTYRNGGVF